LEESRDYYIGRIVAYDNGSPPRSATVTAVININRNVNSPVFNPTIYEETILETEATNYLIMRVSATDADRVVRLKSYCLSCSHVNSFIAKNTFSSGSGTISYI